MDNRYTDRSLVPMQVDIQHVTSKRPKLGWHDRSLRSMATTERHEARVGMVSASMPLLGLDETFGTAYVRSVKDE
jgi:hypothetical protein